MLRALRHRPQPMTRPAFQRPAADSDRLIGSLLRVGTVQSIDLEAGKVVVAMGEQTTPPIDWLMPVGDTTIWIPPTVGQQVLVIAPEGDIEQGMVLNGLPSSAFAPLFLGQANAIRFRDGAQVSYDPEEEHLQVETPGRVTMTAPGGVTIIGDTTITGNVSIDGDTAITGNATVDKKVTATEDVVVDVPGAPKSLKSHVHTGGTISGKTGAPV